MNTRYNAYCHSVEELDAYIELMQADSTLDPLDTILCNGYPHRLSEFVVASDCNPWVFTHSVFARTPDWDRS